MKLIVVRKNGSEEERIVEAVHGKGDYLLIQRTFRLQNLETVYLRPRPVCRYHRRPDCPDTTCRLDDDWIEG